MAVFCDKLIFMERQKYALVIFKPFGKEYTYSCTDAVRAGNVVLVGVGGRGETKRALVTDASYFAAGALPCDESKVQPILEVVSESDEDGEFYEDMNVLFAREEPRYMNALWSRAENYDEYVEELPLYGDIEHKFGGRITVFITPTKFVIHYAIRGVAEGKCEAFSKADMLAVTKNLKCGIDFFMRHRDKVEEGFVTDLFKKPTVIPIIHDERHPRDEFEDEEEGFEEEEDFSEFEEDFDEFDEDFDENFDEE